jgi:hypothetical protein
MTFSGVPFTAWKHEERNRHRDRQMYLLNSGREWSLDFENFISKYHEKPIVSGVRRFLA